MFHDTTPNSYQPFSNTLLDGDRLSDLFEVSIDEVAWRKGHRYLTLVGDHRRRCVVWGAEGKGQAAADQFFAELDPDLLAASPTPETAEVQPARSAEDGAPDAPPRIGERAARLAAVSMDMTGGYAKSVREHAPQAVICIDNYHVVQVRHEALPVRAGCKTPPPGCRGSPVKLRTARPRSCGEGRQAVLTKTRRPGTVGPGGRGERDGEA